METDKTKTDRNTGRNKTEEEKTDKSKTEDNKTERNKTEQRKPDFVKKKKTRNEKSAKLGPSEMMGLMRQSCNERRKNVDASEGKPKVNDAGEAGDLNCPQQKSEESNTNSLRRSERAEFRIMHQNICSLRNKIEDLEVCMDSLLVGKIDVLCLTEHWIKAGQENAAAISNFELAACFARKKSKGGGAMIYVNRYRKWKYRSRPDINTIGKENEFEACGIEIKGQRPTIIVAVYRPPGDKNMRGFLLKLTRLITVIERERKRLLIIGDINIDFLAANEKRHKLEEILTIHNLEANVTFPTRITRNTSTAIDNIISNFTLNNKAQSIETGLSDHLGQTINIAIHTKNEEPRFIYTRKLAKSQMQTLAAELEAKDWHTVFMGTTTDEKFQNFLSIFLEAYQRIFPKKKTRVTTMGNKRKEWITKEIIEESKKKRKLYILTRKKNGERYEEDLKAAKKKVTRLSRKSKITHNDKKIRNANNRQKVTWEIIDAGAGRKDTRKRTDDSDLKLQKDNKLITDSRLVANTFNDHFTTIAERTIDNATDTTGECIRKMGKHQAEGADKMKLDFVDEREIIKIIRELKPKKSSGWDEVPSKVIKGVSNQTACPLAHIINSSFATGVFPTHAKRTIIKPIFKKGVATDVDNYRPIALLTFFSKIIEKAFLHRLNNFLIEKQIITANQHGFRRGYSTTTAIFDMVHKVTQALSNKMHISAIMCDLSKAFDTINHAVLVEKLKTYGIRDKAGEWVQSYLTGREQAVIFTTDKGKMLSNWNVISTGIPQGSLLAPILFSLYINDLPAQVSNKSTSTILYADDTSLIVSGNSEDDLNSNISQALNNIKNWFLPNKLKLNDNKTNVMVFKSKGKSALITTESGNKIVDNSTFLGVHVDFRLKWKEHVKQLVKRVNSASFALKMLANQVSLPTLKIAFHANIQSIISYGILVWGGGPEAKKVFVSQKRAIRILKKVGKRRSCRKYFTDLNILTAPCIYILTILLFVKDHPELFKQNKDVHGRNTRSKNELRPGNCKSALGRQDATQKGPVFYNSLPQSLKQDMKRCVFKAKVKEFLILHCFYNTEEFLNRDNSNCKYSCKYCLQE